MTYPPTNHSIPPMHNIDMGFLNWEITIASMLNGARMYIGEKRNTRYRYVAVSYIPIFVTTYIIWSPLSATMILLPELIAYKLKKQFHCLKKQLSRYMAYMSLLISTYEIWSPLSITMDFLPELIVNVSVNPKPDHPPGDPRGFAHSSCPWGRLPRGGLKSK